MNIDQRRYSMQRAKEVLVVRTSKLKEKFTKTVKGISEREKMKQVRDGIAVVKYNGWTLKTPIGECFIFEDVGHEEFDKKGFNAESEKLRKEYAKVTDEIMLGDETKAKKLLIAFDK